MHCKAGLEAVIVLAVVHRTAYQIPKTVLESPMMENDTSDSEGHVMFLSRGDATVIHSSPS